MARSFNGTSDYIDCGSATGSLDITGSITVAAWVNVTGFPTTTGTGAGTSFGVIAEKGYDGVNEQYTLRFLDPGPAPLGAHLELDFISYNGTQHGATWTFGSSIVTGTWYHLAGTFDGSTWAVYQNGVSKATSSDATAPAHSSKTFTLGAADISGTKARFFNGKIAEVGIWNVALTASELLALASGQRNYMIRRSSLAGYYPLDGLASPEPDLSGNADNGTLTGTAAVTGPPITMLSPRWPQNITAAAAPSQIFRHTGSPMGHIRMVPNVIGY